jgi:BON domain
LKFAAQIINREIVVKPIPARGHLLEDIDMSLLPKKKTLAVCSVVAIAISGVAMQASAHQPDPATDGLQEQVQAALQSDQYFYDAHVDVSIENGNVVLRGLVFSDWDLRDALRIARKAAGGRRVIDNLSIVTGGRR